MNHKKLLAQKKAIEAEFVESRNLHLRAHRALSWLGRAEQPGTDHDTKFIFLWIAFNAAYASETSENQRLEERKAYIAFIRCLIRLDSSHKLDQLVWKTFADNLRTLLKNPYVFPGYWAHQRGEITEGEWKRSFEKANLTAFNALEKSNTPVLLSIVLSRIYVLRNQILHGGATWNSRVNRTQVRDCSNFLGKLVPVILELMLLNPAFNWGEPMYPVMGKRPT